MRRAGVLRHAMTQCSTPPLNRSSGREQGFSILEVLIAGALLATALLGHTASIFSEQKMSTAQRARSSALLASEQFMERMRSDDDWVGLYDRLRTLALLAQTPGGTVHLDDGRRVYPATDYYDDFVLPAGLRELHILVDVPAVPEAGGAVPPVMVLREDVPLAAFGLPTDLNGDGVIDDATHDADYRVLPLVVTVRWQAPGAPSEELRISTWLWGQR